MRHSIDTCTQIREDATFHRYSQPNEQGCDIPSILARTFSREATFSRYLHFLKTKPAINAIKTGYKCHKPAINATKTKPAINATNKKKTWISKKKTAINATKTKLAINATKNRLSMPQTSYQCHQNWL
ncbi:hypothetical protein PS029_18890, partial [Yersinia pestis]|nr:hypothetical protein [Yersinia pestis]